jgi:hypothetical protein
MAAMAAAAEALSFPPMSEAEMRLWVEANPGRVNDRDTKGVTPLVAAAVQSGSISLVVWLLDEKGADVNATMASGRSALHHVTSLDILTVLMDRGADPTIADRYGELPLIMHAVYGSVDVMTRLLQDLRVRATVNAQRRDGYTALHVACNNEAEEAALKIDILLQAGGDPTVTDRDGLNVLGVAQRSYPTLHAAIALLEQALAESEKASLLVKARRLAVAANSNIVVPSCLQTRVVQGQPLPRIALLPLTDGQNVEEEQQEEGEESRKLRTALAFMCGLGRDGMPRDVFRVVMDLVMPSWDPLRRKNTGAVPQMPPQG